MFKSLLRTIPTISGNYTLACKLNNYINIDNIKYRCCVDDAIIIPLDNNQVLHKVINVNLINGKYEFDVKKYFKEMSSLFYKDTYVKNENIFEHYNIEKLYELNDSHNKNFEFGCKRLSLSKYNYQFQFYAPIYINNYDDLPDFFVLNIHYNQNLIKQIHIPIKQKYNQNKLRIYLQNFTNKILNNVPLIWKFDEDKIIYNKVIDCANGGIINFTSHNVIKHNKVNQLLLNDIDNMLSKAYKDNNIILSECIPLSFIFNINDIIDELSSYYFDFNKFFISGEYVKDNKTCDLYDFSYNYHNFYSSYYKYDNLSNKITNTKINICNTVPYGLSEGTNYRLSYQNTFNLDYCRWSLFNYNDYIVNTNIVFNYHNFINNFPIFKNSAFNDLYINGKVLDNNFILPINEYVYEFDDNIKDKYKLFIENNYVNWFNIYNIHKNDLTKYVDITEYNKSNNINVFYNGVQYQISDISEDIKYFGVFVNPILINYKENIIEGNIIIDGKNSKYDDKYINISNKFYYDVFDDYSNKEESYKNYLKNEFINGNLEKIYVENSNPTYYAKYEDLTLEKLFSTFKNRLDEFNNYKNISKLLKNNLDEMYDIFSEVYSYIVNKIEGFEYLDISDTYIDDSDFFNNLFIDNPELKRTLYYSNANNINKINLYNSIKNNSISNREILGKNNTTLFLKSSFVKIIKLENIEHIVSEDGIYKQLYTLYKSNTNIEQGLINQSIDVIKNVFKLDNLKKHENYWDLFNEINKIELLDYDNNLETSNINIVKSYITKIIIVYIIYKLIKNESNRIDKYHYIYNNNRNNILINGDYFKKISKKSTCEYKDLYIHIDNNTFINSLISKYKLAGITKDVYLNIKNKSQLEYVIEHFNITEFYHHNKFVDSNLNIISLNEPISIITYLKKKIYEYFTNDTQNKDENENIIFKQSQKDLLKEFIIEDDNKLYFQLLTNNGVKLIPINLYVKVRLYKYHKNLDDIKIYDGLEEKTLKDIVSPLNIFIETNNTSNILYKNSVNNINYTNDIFVESIYDNYLMSNINKHKFNTLLKNILIIDNCKVYHNPFNILNEYDIDYVLDNWDEFSNIKLYKESNINSVKIRKEFNDNKYRLIIDYYLTNSSNSFNVEYCDENDNMPIYKINDINIDYSNYLDNIFQSIYPVLKNDLMIEVINILSSKSYGINVVIPKILKINIEYDVYNKTDLLNTAVEINKENTFTLLKKTNLFNNYIYVTRYFGNIMPTFNKIDQYIYNNRSKIFIINSNDKKTYIADKNNIYISNINIYKYDQIAYIENEEDTNIKFIDQIEYKHFNNNLIYNLPNEIKFTHDDVEYFYIEKLNEFKSSSKCYEYFKKYLKNNYMNIIDNENDYLFLFNKYNITYIQEDEVYHSLNNIDYMSKVYKIIYKLNLI